jgi:thioredoxin-dependent peroxiredoxin
VNAALQLGDRFPADRLEATVGGSVDLAALDGPLLVYFYPRAGTETCTREAVEFNRHHAQFEQAGVRVLGVSVDPESEVASFAAEHRIRFPLVSDPDGSLTNRVGVMKTYDGYGDMAARVSFLLDRDAVVRRIWRVEDVVAHPLEVLEAARDLLAEASA